MIQSKDCELLEKYVKGECTFEEENYIFTLFADNEDEKELIKQMQLDWNKTIEQHSQQLDLDYLLDRVHHLIHLKEKQQKISVPVRIYQSFSLIAAILIVPLIIAGGIWIKHLEKNYKAYQSEQVVSVIHAPMGSRISFTLPDSTKGWLNSGSSLEYRLPFTNSRSVNLTGEAWFDVAHSINQPFVVQAGSSKVKVLGTKFNLNAYPDENYVEVVLEEGKVEFMSRENESGIIMSPNERLVFSRNSINVSKTDAWKYNGWKEGKLIFRGDSMAEVARRIERWYNVEVEIVDRELELYAFRGTFQDDSLSEVLKYLSMTSPIRYKISERKTGSDGTVEKQKVQLFKR